MKNCPTCQASYPSNFAVCPQDGTALVEVGVWSEGTVVRGKYRILSKVGQGGMGAVYKALHLAFEEFRALKVMSPELMNDDLFVKRFKQEAVITRKLQHPNAVRVDDIDEAEDGLPFIVMEYIEGQSLKKLILDLGPLPAPRVCSIAKQVASALAAAHALGMVHRDIKPENIVLVETPAGEQAKVLDFGIAKLKEARIGGAAGLTLTGTGVVVGTPKYMSPEQAMGKRGDELDGRSDIYSLGIVMYQMLTGELPFKADTTLEILMAHVQVAPTPIRELHPELQIPDAIANLVMKCLEKKRELRASSAGALIEEIERVEKDIVPAGATRVISPTVVVSPEVLGAVQSEVAGRGGASIPASPVRPPVASPPTPTPKPRSVTPAPVPRPAPVPARPSESRWGLWVSIAILVVGLGGGAWYFTAHRGSVVPNTRQGEAAPPVARPADQVKSANTVSSSDAAQGSGSAPKPVVTQTQQSVNTALAPSYSRPAEETPPGAQTSQAAATRRSETRRSAPSEVKPSVDRKKISAAIAMGDLYFNRGEYADAIREYQNAQKLDPSNTVLRDRLDRAQKAKAAEERVLQ